jgi:ribonuclease HI
LFAFNQALKFLKDKEVMIYTDSKYAFGVAHTFGNILVEMDQLTVKDRI